MASCYHEDHEGDVEDVVRREVGGVEVTFCDDHDPLADPTVAGYFDEVDA